MNLRIFLIAWLALLTTSLTATAGDRSNLSDWEQKVQTLETANFAACQKTEQLRTEYQRLKSSGSTQSELAKFRGRTLADMRLCKSTEADLLESRSRLAVAAHNYLDAELVKGNLDAALKEAVYVRGNAYIQNFLYIHAFEKRNISALRFILSEGFRPIGYCEERYLVSSDAHCYIDVMLSHLGVNFEDKTGYWNAGFGEFTKGYKRKWFEDDYRRFAMARLKYQNDSGEILKPKSLGRKAATADEIIAVNKCKVAKIKRMGKYPLYQARIGLLFPTDLDGLKKKKYHFALQQVERDVSSSASYLYDGIYLTKNIANHAVDVFSAMATEPDREAPDIRKWRENVVWRDAPHLSKVCGDRF